MKIVNRLSGLPAYIFSRVDEIKKILIEEGRDIIDLGIGDPDIKTPEFIVNSLLENTKEEYFWRYPPYNGIEEFRKAVSLYYKKRYDVELDPDEEVVALIGSKEGIAHIFLALADNNDYVLIPDPAYPVYDTAARIAGCSVYKINLNEKNNYIPNINNIYPDAAKKAKIMLVNYPNNPTGATASLDFYRELVEFGNKFDIAIVNDGAYLDIIREDLNPVSLMQAEGALNTCIEFGTLSKSYSMTGWRIGYAVGNRDMLKRLMVVKTNFDSGQFYPIQRAGADALNYGDEFVKNINYIYNNRREYVNEKLKKLGLDVYDSKGTFYVWFKIPKRFKSEEFADFLLEKTGVLITPGNAYGMSGEGYCRISLTHDNIKIEEAMERILKLSEFI